MPPAEGDQVTFQVLFTSDIHGAFRDYDYIADRPMRGGFARLATCLRRERAAFNGHSFTLDCGDAIQGNGTAVIVRARTYRPFPLIAAFEAAGYDMAQIGNHEFNFGKEALLAAYSNVGLKKLCANVTGANGALLPGFDALAVYPVPGGPRVAFIGVVTPNIDIWDNEGIRADRLTAHDAAQTVRRILDQMIREDEADLYIVAAHMDEEPEMDRSGSGAREIAALCPEVALIIGAHFHTAKGREDAQRILAGGVPFAENRANAATYGRARISATYECGRWTVRPGGAQTADVRTDIIDVAEDVPPDRAVMDVTRAAHEDLVNRMRSTIVGRLAGGPLIPPARIRDMSEAVMGPNALIGLITGAMRFVSGAQIAAASPNSPTANCLPGPISLGCLSRMCVYEDNALYLIGMTGAQLLKWMEWSYAFFGTVSGGPAFRPGIDVTLPYGTRPLYQHDQFAGLTYEVDVTRPAGERVRAGALEDGTPFEADREYTVVTSDYRANTVLLRADPEGVFAPGEPLPRLISRNLPSPAGHRNLMDIVGEYIAMRPGGVIDNAHDDNWRFVGLEYDGALFQAAAEHINRGDMPFDPARPITEDAVRAQLKKEESS